MPLVHPLLLLLCLLPFLLFAAATSAPQLKTYINTYPSIGSSLPPPGLIRGRGYLPHLSHIQLPKTMVDDPPKKKRRKTGPKYGRRIRGKKLTATSPVPSAVEDINPALDDNVGPDPNVNDDHTIIVIRGSGPDNLHPAAERSDSVVDPVAEDAVMEDVPVDDQPDARLAPGDAHIAETRVSSKCGPSKTTNDKNKTIKSLRNKLYYQSHLRDAADDSVGVLKSEVKKLQDEFLRVLRGEQLFKCWLNLTQQRLPMKLQSSIGGGVFQHEGGLPFRFSLVRCKYCGTLEHPAKHKGGC